MKTQAWILETLQSKQKFRIPEMFPAIVKPPIKGINLFLNFKSFHRITTSKSGQATKISWDCLNLINKIKYNKMIKIIIKYKIQAINMSYFAKIAVKWQIKHKLLRLKRTKCKRIRMLKNKFSSENQILN